MGYNPFVVNVENQSKPHAFSKKWQKKTKVVKVLLSKKISKDATSQPEY